PRGPLPRTARSRTRPRAAPGGRRPGPGPRRRTAPRAAAGRGTAARGGHGAAPAGTGAAPGGNGAAVGRTRARRGRSRPLAPGALPGRAPPLLLRVGVGRPARGPLHLGAARRRRTEVG